MRVTRGASTLHFGWVSAADRPSARLLAIWVVSLTLHVMIGAAAISLFPSLTTGRLPQVFTWQVSLVDAPAAHGRFDQGQAVPTEPAEPARKSSAMRKASAPSPVPRMDPTSVQAVAPTAWPLPAPAIMDGETSSSPSDDRMNPPTDLSKAATPLPTVMPRIDEASSETERVDPAVPSHPHVAPASASEWESSAVAQPTEPTARLEPQAEPALNRDELPRSSETAQPPSVGQAIPASAVMGEEGQPAVRHDYGWLGTLLRSRIVELKRYPMEARSRRLEGRVVVRVVVDPGGTIVDVVVATSSGHALLDREAVKLVQRAGPLPLRESILLPRVVLKIPVNYSLRY